MNQSKLSKGHRVVRSAKYLQATEKKDTIFCLFLLGQMSFEMISPSCRLSHSRGQLDM